MGICESIAEYVKGRYGVLPERIHPEGPETLAFRHEDSARCFAVFARVPARVLGLSRAGAVDVVNVVPLDPWRAYILTQQKGYFRGYPQRRGSRIAILLDGTVPRDEICALIDESFLATASRQKRAAVRPPKEWLVPANPKYYDIVHAFDERDAIEWKQGAGIKTGDTVYMYVGAPVSAILFRCSVTETDIPYDFHTKELTITALMKIRLLARYPHDKFTFSVLKQKYGIFAVRGPRGVPSGLSVDLAEQEGRPA